MLLPEAILQILLWRTGHRTSMELLSDKEEMELHEKGEELLRERDWVNDVVRLRKLKMMGLDGKSQASMRGHSGASYGKGRETASGRPKRNVATLKSYLE